MCIRDRLGYQNRGRAVGDQAQERRQKRLEPGILAQKGGQDVHTHQAQHQIQDRRKQEDIERQLNRMPHRRLHDTAVVAAAAAPAHIPDMLMLFFISEQEIQQIAEHKMCIRERA